jgi:LPXTG-site transpeptidase (sortase) family protein
MKKLLIVILIFSFITPVHAGEPEGTLIIPSLSLYKPIQFIPLIDKQYDLTELGYGAARLDGTVWDDVSWGRTVLVGHTPGGFEDINQLKMNDKIIILTKTAAFSYIVFDNFLTTVDDVQWLMPTTEHELLLITCEGELRRIIRARRTIP